MIKLKDFSYILEDWSAYRLTTETLLMCYWTQPTRIIVLANPI